MNTFSLFHVHFVLFSVHFILFRQKTLSLSVLIATVYKRNKQIEQRTMSKELKMKSSHGAHEGTEDTEKNYIFFFPLCDLCASA